MNKYKIKVTIKRTLVSILVGNIILRLLGLIARRIRYSMEKLFPANMASLSQTFYSRLSTLKVVGN